jgi:hypothetical protein
LFTQLGNPDRRWIILAGGDHAALVEDTQPAFIAAIVSFLQRPKMPAVPKAAPKEATRTHVGN